MIIELRPKYPGIPLLRMCRLLGVPRSQVYRKPAEGSVRRQFYADLTVEIAQITLLNPGYGYRRVRRALAKKTCDAATSRSPLR